MPKAVKADLLVYATLADNLFQLLADVPIVDFAENRIVLAVHVHNLVRGQFPDVCETECGEAGKDEQVTGESKRGIGKLMLYKQPDFSLRKIFPFFYVGRDAELRKRVSWYQAVVMRP